LAIPLFFFLITGCGSQNNALPLPSSAKIISTNTIQLPFPYSESINGETWGLSRNTSNHFVVQVSNEGKIVKTFPVNSISNGSITLGGQKYTVKGIKVDNDNLSGFVMLVKQ
jgi:hypothetical protein